MKTRYSKLLLAFLLLILIGPPVVAEGPPKDGPYVEYYGNGQKNREAHYTNGRQEGVSNTWYENGQKYHEEHWQNGKKDGLFVEWDKNGNKTKEIQYQNGKEISRKEF